MSVMDKAKMAQKAMKLQKDLKRMKIEAEAGDGDVKVVAGMSLSQSSMNGEVQEITIKPSAVEDIDRLERLLVSAFNHANKELMAEATEKMQEIAGSMNLPGM